jgi:hypothetical protein
LGSFSVDLSVITPSVALGSQIAFEVSSPSSLIDLVLYNSSEVFI